jgi:hypothetical protein
MKQIATDRRARLGAVIFEELAIMKSAWGPELYDLAAWNSEQVEEVKVFDFEEMLDDDVDGAEWDKEMEPDYDFDLIENEY